MRALVVSDIHGNLHALEAVLAAAGPVDQIWNLGDAVGYGANPNEVIDLLRERAAVNVRGNHDRVCAGLTSSQGFNPVAAEAAAWTQAALRPENLTWLKAVPKGPVRAEGNATCVHGSPLDEDHYILSMRDAWTPLQRMGTPVTFFGHTHVQGAFLQQGADWEELHPEFGAGEAYEVRLAEGMRVLINPGSVGQPRDRDARAAFAIFDSEEQTLEFRRVPYDVRGAQAAIRAAGLPERLAQRLEAGR
ncbi:MAG TPA: metallophosphoesterase family protein [Acidobacteriaceae bacterium]|nr:metallophosphoesterase family protein [Acidobacteriaceae bacterium]